MLRLAGSMVVLELDREKNPRNNPCFRSDCFQASSTARGRALSQESLGRGEVRMLPFGTLVLAGPSPRVMASEKPRDWHVSNLAFHAHN